MRRLAVGLSVLLVSCGGGGSGGGSPPPSSSPPPPAPAPPPPPPVNQAPTITSLTFAATEDHDYVGTMTATDPEGTAITFARTSDPTHGQVTSFTAAGAFTYRPAANFTGSDTFNVRATDAANAEVAATITINVANGDDDAPILRTDILQATGANPLVDVLANDEEPDGEALTLTLVGNPDFGSATVENRKIRFNLPAGFKGFNRFQYRAVDGSGQGGVVKAVVFVDAQPSRLVYFSTGSATHGYSEVYVDDFVSTRKLTSHETTYPVDGLYPYTFVGGDSGRNIIVTYKLDSHYVPINGLAVIPTDGSFAPRRITPAPTGNISDAYEMVSDISPDGRWVVYKHQFNGEVRYFLAELTQNGVTTELALPAGAISLPADYAILFGPGSQYFYAPVEFSFPNFKRGSAIYRYSTASPAAAPQLVSPAAREDVSIDVRRVSPDEARILFTEYGQGDFGAALRILTIANPSAAITLSHAFGAQERISGFIHTNAQFSRVYYPTEDGVDPNYTFRLYGADTTIAGSASLITNLPADEWRPEVWELSPDETSVLISAPVRVAGQRYDRASTLALTPGAQPHVVVPQLQWLNQYRFIDAGRFVLYGDGSSIYRVPATGAPNPALVASRATSAYDLAPDGAYVATCFSDWQASPGNNHLWLANTMSTGSVQQVEFSGVGDATAFVSTWGFIPAQ
ncbi:MAG TPA: Ig-like domain-containing protein [Vicinamibacterales bacterium]|nr:Ig-like domain-containing protein [Vicinamibacterales bacterium]